MDETTARELERKLFTDLQEAREAYAAAAREYERLLEFCHDLGLVNPIGGCCPASEGDSPISL